MNPDPHSWDWLVTLTWLLVVPLLFIGTVAAVTFLVVELA